MQETLFDNDATEQFLMTRFQLFNWGTFSGLHDIAIAPEGHLFIGGSGSGKSTLLDAMSVLLTPGHINFNAAAREGERKSDRTILSYMRGAWTTQQNAEGRSVLQYLRNKSTWTAIALTYKSAARTVTLLFVAFIRGNSNDDDRVTRRYYVVPHEMDLSELSDFSARNYDWSFIGKKLPQAKHYPRFSPYCEAFRKVFGIEEETVFKLLHKAQSARNLGDLNEFLRKFMLDVPKTFDVADTLVKQFTELYSAHESVVKARNQVEVLSVAKKHHDLLKVAQEQSAQLDALHAYMPTWMLGQRQTLLNTVLPQMHQKEHDARACYDEQTRLRDENRKQIDDLNRRYSQSGGERLLQLKTQWEQADQALSVANRMRGRMKDAIEPLAFSLPDTHEAFLHLQNQLKDYREGCQEELRLSKEMRQTHFLRKSQLSDEFQSLMTEIKAMESSKSNIPSHLLTLRKDLARYLNLPEDQLPFVGELLEIKEGEGDWQGAVERVLHNFATSILVDDRHYQAFASLVNSINLGTRLVFLRVKQPVEIPADTLENSLFSKLKIKEGAWQSWLKRELIERFDYVCVNSVQALTQHRRAMTIEGQIKHNQTRHEKDDRFSIKDRSRWVLGFSNEEKLELFKNEAHELSLKITEEDQTIQDCDDQETRIIGQSQQASVALSFDWENLDVATLTLNVRDYEKRYNDALKNANNLKAIEDRLKELTEKQSELDLKIQNSYSSWNGLKTEREGYELDLQNTSEALAIAQIVSALEEELVIRLNTGKHALSLKNLPQMQEKMISLILTEQNQKLRTIAEETTKTTRQFSEFATRWPDATMHLDDTLASAPEYFEKLDDLIKEGLPNYEQKFKDLLTNEVGQNLADLYREIDDERAMIKERLIEVNRSLREVAFNRIGNTQSHLRIAIADKKLPEVHEFNQLKNQILAMSAQTNVKALSAQEAERYFKLIDTLVQKFNVSGKDLAAQRWRERVLDVRQHMDFYGEEYEKNESGEKVIEVYESAAGKSGGQRQKLTVTCLAAALRYQLGGDVADYPRYAAVILDEAFDKADSEFTDIALNIFKDFRFQMIIATPEKSVMTLDPYVGGTTFVSCKDRNASSVLNVVYDSKTGHFSPQDGAN